MADVKFNAGDRVRFAGYSNLEPGFNPILTEGQLLQIITVMDNGNYQVVGINEDGARLNMDGGIFQDGDQPLGDEAFPDEITALEEGDAAAVSAPEEEVAGDDDQPETDQTETDAGDTDTGDAEFANMTKAQMDEFVSVNGVETPKWWAKLKNDDRVAFLRSWVAENGSDDVEGDAESVDEVEDGDGEFEDTSDAMPETQPQGADLVRTYTDSESVRALLAEKDAIAAAKDLVKLENRTHHTLGGILKHIDESGIYKSLGYDGKKGFEEFCSTELGVEYRKARYLIASYNKFNSLGIDEARLEQIGWSKAKELARIDLSQLETDIDTLLTYANDHTREELIGHIKENYEVATRAEKVKTTTFSFKVVEDNGAVIQNALDHAKSLIGEDDTNRALVHICGDWMNAADGTDLDLDTFMRMGIERFGSDAVRAALDAVPAEDEHETEMA